MLIYRCCEHCSSNSLGCLSGHVVPCAYPACPGRMPIDPDMEG